MEMTLSGNQLLISKEQEDFFKFIQKQNIEVNLKIDNATEHNVLANKSSDKNRLDITKLSKIKNNLKSCNTNKFKVKNIDIELECI